MLIPTDQWFKTRKYLHFDSPLSRVRAEKLVLSPESVARHSFYPFLSLTIKSEKITKDKITGRLDTKEKTRGISYASHCDSHIYSYYCQVLGQRYEELLGENDISDCVLAFRKFSGKCNIHFANDAFDEISRRRYCSVIAMDIKGFFDEINHGLLKRIWCKVLQLKKLPADHFAVYKSVTKFATVERDVVYEMFDISKNKRKKDLKRICNASDFRKYVRGEGAIEINRKGKGIPQGSPISALLSNIYMLDFDIYVKKLMTSIGGKYVRYCDDLLCIVPHGQEDRIERLVSDEIDKLKLEIHPDKTKKHRFTVVSGKQSSDKPLQYLGFLFDGQRKILRSASLSRYSDRMKRGVRLAKLTQFSRNEDRMARGVSPENLYKRKLYERYSHLGKRNFIRYGLRSANIMKSDAIRKQLKPLWRRLQTEIQKF